MLKEQFDAIITEFGLDSIKIIEFNNNKRYEVNEVIKNEYPYNLDPHFSSTDKLNFLILDHKNEQVHVYEATGREPHVHIVPYEFVEGIVVKKDFNEKTFTDNNGNLIRRQVRN